MPRLLLVDNYDSFTHILAHLFGAAGARVDVIRNDDERIARSIPAVYDGIVLGPGPGRPKQAGRTVAIVAEAAGDGRPLFGVCLGLQAIGEALGGNVVHAPALMHGKTSTITHDGTGVFAGLPGAFAATRYHSLCVAHAPFPAVLHANAVSDDGVIQGLHHRELPLYGVQFHPESILTDQGAAIAANFLHLLQ